ncbi:MAG TPA: DUF177 domain-containing protein [Gaiellaceae bacterium]|jgi:uncharacterized protein|nr:DUF177 domain-containing protein [Gaiellaceae bacterium]
MTSFNLHALKLRSGEQYQDEQEVQLSPLELGGQRYLPVPEKIPAELRVSRASTGTVFELDFTGRLHGPCQRCLADAVVERRIRTREYQAASPDAADDLQSPYVHADRLDLSQWARDALALELPVQILCRPECAGLCPVCGKDLNVEPHEHEEEQLDPRWTELEKLRGQL